MKNNEIQLFNNDEFGQVRTLLIDGEPWFVGKDVANILGYENPHDDIVIHLTDNIKVLNWDSIKKIRKTPIPIINESGLYALIFGDKLEKVVA